MVSKLKILIFGLNYAPEPTGIGKYTGEMASWLSKQGHKVDIITALPHYPAWEIDENYKSKGFHVEYIEDVRVFRSPLFVPAPEKVGAKGRIKLELSFSFNTLRYWLPIFFKKHTYDLVIAVCPAMEVGVYPFLYRLFRGVPWVFHIQDLQVDAAVRLGILGQGKATKLLYRIECFLLNRASKVSSITEAMTKRIVEKGADIDKTWLFPNWSDIEFVHPLNFEQSIRAELGYNLDQVLFMYAGNMGEKQGLDLLLDVAETLRSDSTIQFLLVGAGAAKERLMNHAEEKSLPNVRFLPVQPLEKLPRLLAAADVHLVIQKSEAADLVMPSKLTNILAAGRPTLATADPGTALYEVLINHETGMVVSSGDAEGLTKKIQYLSERGALRKEMGIKARKYAEQYLDKEVILKDFEAKLLSLVKKNGG